MGFKESGDEASKEKKARHSECFLKQVATNRTLLGASAAAKRVCVTSVLMVGRRSWATEVGSPKEVMMFPRGVMRIVVPCSYVVKDCGSCGASSCAAKT